MSTELLLIKTNFACNRNKHIRIFINVLCVFLHFWYDFLNSHDCFLCSHKNYKNEEVVKFSKKNLFQASKMAFRQNVFSHIDCNFIANIANQNVGKLAKRTTGFSNIFPRRIL